MGTAECPLGQAGTWIPRSRALRSHLMVSAGQSLWDSHGGGRSGRGSRRAPPSGAGFEPGRRDCSGRRRGRGVLLALLGSEVGPP